MVAGLGITVGFHRYLTHGSFKAKRWLRVALAVAGSLAIQGDIIQWVADHRRHHAFSDLEGDPHSPWRFGDQLLGPDQGPVPRAHGLAVPPRAVQPGAVRPGPARRPGHPAGSTGCSRCWSPSRCSRRRSIGGLVTWSWQGALTAFFWAGLVRIGLLHHVTWSINSVCHVYGERPFEMREGDKASNFWPLAILSFGESWHNLHHADPTSARHGVLRGQIDISARVIWLFEKLGWARDVRWPKPERLAAKLVKPAQRDRERRTPTDGRLAGWPR